MNISSGKIQRIVIYFFILVCFYPFTLHANVAKDIGSGFHFLGVAAPISTNRGYVATVDGQGNNVVLSWLNDYRGGYELLKIDATTGKTEEYPTPFSLEEGRPFASILSSRNKYYVHFESHFVEFDINKNEFSFVCKTTPKTAMSMTEDDNGVIWSATYPDSGLVSYNPTTQEFRDFGSVYYANWKQYPRYIAADDKGWIYFAIGKAACQIIAFNPETTQTIPVIPEFERERGMAYVYRDRNGKVYGNTLEDKSGHWYELYNGEILKDEYPSVVREKKYIAGRQGLNYKHFPDGKRISELDFEKRRLNIKDDLGAVRELDFRYESQGAYIMSVGLGPKGTICGGTTHPKYFFNYDPETKQLTSRSCQGQWNTLAVQKDKLFIGSYIKGQLMEWDPLKEWNPTKQNQLDGNPFIDHECSPDIYRPYRLLVHADGKTIIMAGSPDYGYTGGGLLFWNSDSGTFQQLDHRQIVPNHSTRSLVSLDKNMILGGTTITPGTGGVTKAENAVLYLMDFSTKEILWRRNVISGSEDYSDLCLAQNGLVYGIADRSIFFVYNPFAAESNALIFKGKIGMPIPYQQGQRIFVKSPDDVYMLCKNGIGKIDSQNYKNIEFKTSPEPITAGGAYFKGRIYFAGGASLYSYVVE